VALVFVLLASAAVEAQSFRGEMEEKRRAALYQELFRQKQFAKLDAIAAKLRSETKHENPFWWESEEFFSAIGTLEEPLQTNHLRAWVAERPSSHVARLALAAAMYESAWKSRGTGFSNTVTPAAQKDYRQKMLEARKLLADAERAGASVEGKYWVQLISLSYEMDGGDLLSIVRRAAKVTHDPIIFRTSSKYRYQRWSGDFTSMVPLAEEAATLTRSTFGEHGMYFYLAHQTHWYVDHDEWVKYRFDRDRLRRGCLDMIRAAPKWIPVYHRCAWLATVTNDRTWAQALFKHPEVDWYEGAEAHWKTSAFYNQARTWALQLPR
jgi:hypothetical protein